MFPFATVVQSIQSICWLYLLISFMHDLVTVDRTVLLLPSNTLLGCLKWQTTRNIYLNIVKHAAWVVDGANLFMAYLHNTNHSSQKPGTPRLPRHCRRRKQRRDSKQEMKTVPRGPAVFA